MTIHSDMPGDRAKYIEAFREGVNQVDERVPGYRDALLSRVAMIVKDERAHAAKSTHIVKKVAVHVEALGEELLVAGWDPGTKADPRQ